LTVGGNRDVIGTDLSKDRSGGSVGFKTMSSSSDMSWGQEKSSTRKSPNGQRDHERKLVGSGIGTTNNVGHSFVFVGIGERDSAEENDEQESEE